MAHIPKPRNKDFPKDSDPFRLIAQAFHAGAITYYEYMAQIYTTLQKRSMAPGAKYIERTGNRISNSRYWYMKGYQDCENLHNRQLPMTIKEFKAQECGRLIREHQPQLYIDGATSILSKLESHLIP